MKATFLFLFFIFLLVPTYKIQAQEVGVTISELLPDAVGSDSGKEYIELYASVETSLKDWYLINTSQSGTFKKINFAEVFIPTGTYFVIAEDLSFLGINNGLTLGSGKIALYNDFGKLQLFNSSHQVVSEVNYGDSKEGTSWEAGGPLCPKLVHSAVNTPGTQNTNYSSDCFDNEQFPISYPESPITIEKIEFSIDNLKWADTISTFTNTPVYFRYITNEDVVLEEVKWTDIAGNILNSPFLFISTYKNLISVEGTYHGQQIRASSLQIDIQNNTSNKVIITEVYPSPTSPDKEWIEIYNNGENHINLSDYYIEEKTASGVSNNRRVLKNQILASKMYYVLYEDEFNVSLNNSGDTIYLFDILGREVDKFIYTESDKSKSVGRKLENNNFSSETYTTLTPTPLSENKFPEATSEANILEEFTISDINNLKSGTEFLLNVNVSNFIDKYIFISDSTGKLKAKLTKTISEDLIKTTIRTKVKVTITSGVKNVLINPDDIEITDFIDFKYLLLDTSLLNEHNIGNQFETDGVIKEIYSNRYRIELNNQLISVYAKNTSDLKKGENLKVFGTLDFYRNAYRLIEIERILPEVKGVTIENQSLVDIPKANGLIAQPFQEDYSRIYLVTFGYITLGIILVFELIKSRKIIAKFIRVNVISRIKLLAKPMIKY